MSVGAELFTLQSHEIASHWDELRPLIERALPPEWSADEVRHLLMLRKAQLWAAREISDNSVRIPSGIWITKIENTQTARWGLVWLCAGEFEPFKEDALRMFRDHIEPWFRSMGCQSVHIVGRRGWSRVLSGYEERSVVLVKCL